MTKYRFLAFTVILAAGDAVNLAAVNVVNCITGKNDQQGSVTSGIVTHI